MLLLLLLFAAFHSCNPSPAVSAVAPQPQDVLSDPKMMIKSLEELVLLCLDDRISPSQQANKIDFELQDLEDYAQLCASGNTLVPALREVCRWLSQGLPMEAPVDCLTISEGLDINDDEDGDDETKDVAVKKRGLSAALLSAKRLNRDNRRVLGSEFLGKRGLEFPWKSNRRLGSEFLGKRSLGSEFLGKRALGSEFLGKRALGSEFLGKRGLGSEFLGKRGLGSEFLGKRGLGSEFLGKRTLGSEFLGKRSSTPVQHDVIADDSLNYNNQ